MFSADHLEKGNRNLHKRRNPLLWSSRLYLYIYIKSVIFKIYPLYINVINIINEDKLDLIYIVGGLRLDLTVKPVLRTAMRYHLS